MSFYNNQENLLLEIEEKLKDSDSKIEDYRSKRIEFLKYKNDYKYRIFEACLELGKVLLPIFIAIISIEQASQVFNIKAFSFGIAALILILGIVAFLVVLSINKTNSEYEEHIENSLEQVEENHNTAKELFRKVEEMKKLNQKK